MNCAIYNYRNLQSGDIISLNCFPQVQGYYTALERTMFLHHATDDHLKIWEINLATHYKGLTLIRPGVKYVILDNRNNFLFCFIVFFITIAEPQLKWPLNFGRAPQHVICGAIC